MPLFKTFLQFYESITLTMHQGKVFFRVCKVLGSGFRVRVRVRVRVRDLGLGVLLWFLWVRGLTWQCAITHDLCYSLFFCKVGLFDVAFMLRNSACHTPECPHFTYSTQFNDPG